MDPAEIYRHDPALAKPVPDGLQRWLGGPIQRYCADAQNITFSYRLDVNRPLVGSYGLQFIAKVQLLGMKTKEFCMHQIRRYKPESLTRCMQSLGGSKLGTSHSQAPTHAHNQPSSSKSSYRSRRRDRGPRSGKATNWRRINRLGNKADRDPPVAATPKPPVDANIATDQH